MTQMTVERLAMVVGLKQAVRLQILKSRLSESAAVTMQVTDFAGELPTPGPIDECPCCGLRVAEGVLH